MKVVNVKGIQWGIDFSIVRYLQRRGEGVTSGKRRILDKFGLGGGPFFTSLFTDQITVRGIRCGKQPIRQRKCYLKVIPYYDIADPGRPYHYRRIQNDLSLSSRTALINVPIFNL
jgi:hypothetical protein